METTTTKLPKADRSSSDYYLIDDFAARGARGEDYDWNNYDQVTYDAWLVGKRLIGKSAPKEVSEQQDGAAPRVSLHPANWR